MSSENAQETRIVNNNAELNAAVKALADGNGGEVYINQSGGPYSLSISQTNGSPVRIMSSQEGVATLTSLEIINSSGISIDGVRVDTSQLEGRSPWEDDALIRDSKDISITNSEFLGGAVGYLSEATSHDVRGATGLHVASSTEIHISGNSFSNHSYAVKLNNTTEINFVDNEITQWQIDGIHGGGLQDVEIFANRLHTPLGSTQTLGHSDFIQIRMANTEIENERIEISSNILDTNGGPAAQGIHMGLGGTTGKNTDITVLNNVIVSALPRGIGIDGGVGLRVEGNTLLWDQSSFTESSPGAPLASWDPRILLSGRDIEATSNVATWTRINNVQDHSAGYQIQYRRPNDENYVSNHFDEFATVLEGSPLLERFGSSLTWSTGGVVSDGTVDPDDDGVPDDPVGDSPLPEFELYLYDTLRDERLSKLSDGQVLSSSYLNNATFSIVAYVSDNVGSVGFMLGDYERVENASPYALFGDRDGDFFDPEASLFASSGSYSLSVTLYSERQGEGEIVSRDLSFSIEATDDIVPDPGPTEEQLGSDDGDVLTGGQGSDFIRGAGGNDVINGGDGPDTLFGDQGDDIVLGGAGPDLINGGEGIDRLSGGSDDDALDGESGDDLLLGGVGADVLIGGTGDDVLHGEGGEDSIFGGQGGDRLDGGSGADRLFGDDGNDTLSGGEGHDSLYGGAGFDELSGGTGDDWLQGEDGSDVFVFRDGFGSDTIADFDADDAFEFIDLSGVSSITSWSDLVENHLRETDMSSQLTTELGDVLTLVGVLTSTLSEQDFIF